MKAGPNIDHCGGKRKIMTPTSDSSKSGVVNCVKLLQRARKGLKHHIQGKKHKAKVSMRTLKIDNHIRRTYPSSLLNPYTHKKASLNLEKLYRRVQLGVLTT
ncbi:hypothetical protein HKD37_19G053903 [Glycine soja]